MRAVVAFCVLLALAAAVLCVSAQSDPDRVSTLDMFADSNCTESTGPLILPYSPDVACEGFIFNASTVTECSDVNNVTTFRYAFWDNAQCTDTPLFSFSSVAASHTCAPVTIMSGDKKTSTYGRIACNVSDPDVTLPFSSRQQALKIAEATASQQRHADSAPHKSFLARLFDW